MEEIKNWWGVFGLFGCVTGVSGSLKRRCHRQGSLAAPTKLAISIQWCTRRGFYSTHVCVLCFPGPSEKLFFQHSWGCYFYLPFAIYLFRVDDLLALTSQSSCPHPFFPRVEMDCFSCVRLPLDSSQLHLISTVPVEPVGAALGASILSSFLMQTSHVLK